MEQDGYSPSQNVRGTHFFNKTLAIKADERSSILRPCGGDITFTNIQKQIERGMSVEDKHSTASKLLTANTTRTRFAGKGKGKGRNGKDSGKGENQRYSNVGKRQWKNQSTRYKNLQKKRKQVQGSVRNGVQNRDGLRCFDCGSRCHLARSYQCKRPGTGWFQSQNRKGTGKASPTYKAS